MAFLQFEVNTSSRPWVDISEIFVEQYLEPIKARDGFVSLFNFGLLQSIQDAALHGDIGSQQLLVQIFNREFVKNPTGQDVRIFITSTFHVIPAGKVFAMCGSDQMFVLQKYKMLVKTDLADFVANGVNEVFGS